MRSGLTLVAGVVISVVVPQTLSGQCLFATDKLLKPITYSFQPEVVSGELLLHVTLRFYTGSDGTGLLRVPTQWAGEPLHSISNLHADSKGLSIDADLDPSVRHFSGPPEEFAVVSYDLKKDWPGALVHPKQFHPVLLPSYFEITGENALVAPKVDAESEHTVNFDWTGLPHGWALATSFGTSTTSTGLCQSHTGKWKEVDQGLYAGGDFRIHPFVIGRQPAFLAIRGTWSFSDEEATRQIAAVIAEVRTFWHDDNFPYFLVTLKPYDREHDSSDGSAFTNAFWMYISRLDSLSTLLPQMAHEAFHAWNPALMGPQPADSEDLTKWFREGMTEYYAELLTLRAGQLTEQQYLDSINKDLRKFPVSDSEYVRGRVIALWMDAAIRRNTSGRRSLDNVMFEMVRRSKRPYTLMTIFQTANRYLSKASQRLLQDAVLHGADLPMPQALPGVEICAAPVRTTVAVFDAGLDLTHSYANAVITGVVPDGPAYRAGLRDGQKLLKISVYNGDPESLAKFTVHTETADQNISYYPRGRTVEVSQYEQGANGQPSCIHR